MLKIILTTISLSMAVPAAAQMPDPRPAMAAEREAMKLFDWINGHWRGVAIHRGTAGETKVVQTERSGPMLDGTVRMVEGRAYADDGSTAFNALAMISFDPEAKTFRLASHADGRFGVFRIEPRSDGYVWWIPAGPANVRYTATIKDGRWTEIGEYLAPGQPPRQIFSMELQKVADVDWPEAGAVQRR